MILQSRKTIFRAHSEASITYDPQGGPVQRRRSGGGYGNYNTGSSDVGAYGHHGYGHHSGYGHKKKIECCPLVVDPLTLASFLGAIVGGTLFLNMLIANEIMMGRRRRRKRQTFDLWQNGTVLDIDLIMDEKSNLGMTLIEIFSSG